MNQILIDAFSPNKALSKKNNMIMVTLQLMCILIYWLYFTAANFPKPLEIIKALGDLFETEGLIYDLGKSLSLSLVSLFYTVIFSLTIAYLTVLPFFKPLGFLISKFRFLTLVGLSFFFALWTHNGYDLKVALMVFGMTVFFVTSAVDVVHGVTRNALNHPRTLRMSEWEVVYRVRILGTLDKMFDIVRQNFAIAWVLLTMVEGIVKSEGGIGAMLLVQNKYLHLDALVGILMIILFCGISLDYILGVLKNLFCPHSAMVLDKR